MKIQIQIESCDTTECLQIIDALKSISSLAPKKPIPEHKKAKIEQTKLETLPKEQSPEKPKQKREPRICHKQCEICLEYFDTPAHRASRCDKCREIKTPQIPKGKSPASNSIPEKTEEKAIENESKIEKSFLNDRANAPEPEKILRTYSVNTDTIKQKIDAGTLRTRPTKKDEIKAE